MIIKVYEPDLVHNVEIPNNPNKIIDTFITVTNDLFALVQKDDNYILYKADLDKGNKDETPIYNSNEYDSFRFTEIFKYTRKDVNYEEPLKIFVRGSSAKERIDNKEKILVFIIHEQSLYTWTKESFCGESDDEEHYIEECIK